MSLFFCLLSLISSSYGEVLPLESVLRSTREQAPKVLASLEKVIAARENIRASEGAFDSSVNLSYYKRNGGYYPGETFKGKIEKPLPVFGAKVYAGYKKSSGSFPDYEGDALTLDEGQAMAGLSFNLLRNFSIDDKRLKLAISKIDLSQSEWLNKETMMKLQKEASIAYWNWVAAGHKLRVAKDLLQLAQKRQVAFVKRIKKGDLARLYAVENEQYIVKRKTKVEKAKAYFTVAGYYLSLYYRDAEGNPILSFDKNLPGLEDMENTPIKNKDLPLDELKDKNFTLNALKMEIETAKQNVEFFNSRGLPDLKVKYEVLRDYGDGSKTLQGTDHKILVGMDIPLERNLINGKRSAARAKQRVLNHEYRLMRDKLRMRLLQLRTKLEASLNIIQNTKREVALGEELEKGERKKFSSGASDFFVVNLREQNTFAARFKRIEALLDYQETVAKYREILLDFPLISSAK
ncbi:MAG: TolC family protein [Bdellovibrionota bacterium]|nr:TolC family protein [Bdellovibrionota bacterium]